MTGGASSACGNGILGLAGAEIDFADVGGMPTLSKLRILTSCPFSKTRNSFWVSPYTWFPYRSFTTTGTDMSSVPAWNVGLLDCGLVFAFDNPQDKMRNKPRNALTLRGRHL